LTTIFIRTLLFYIILSLMLKLMGKRQIGQLQMTEFVTAVILSEVAALPITNDAIPVSHGLIPLITLASLEVITSYLSSKCVRFRRLMDGSPIILVDKGAIVRKNMDKTRITLDEIFAEIRAYGYCGLEEIQYIILEQSGKISVVPKDEYNRVCPQDMQLKVTEKGVAFPVVVDGKINTPVLKDIKKTKGWVLNELRKQKIDVEEVLFMTVDDTNSVKVVKKQE